MKKWKFQMFTILPVMILLFTACGAETAYSENGTAADDYDVSESAAAQPQEPTLPPVTSPSPIPGALPAVPQPSPIPNGLPDPSEPNESPVTPEIITTVFESGIMGIKFSIEHSSAMDFWLGFNGLAGTDSVLIENWLWPASMIPRTSSVPLTIWEGSTHPANWIQAVTEYLEWNTGWDGRIIWEQRGEPQELFVTSNGLFVVKYVFVQESTSGEEHTTIMFLFRRDGRDFREADQAQIFYSFILHGYTADVEAVYEYARAVLESFMFLDGVAVSLEPSPEAVAIGITAYNFPRIDGSTSATPLMRTIVQAMYAPVEEDGMSPSWNDYDRWFSASRTIPSYELLINNYVDIIIVPDPSSHVLQLAEDAGVGLEFIPVAVEALVFITSVDNPVESITIEQLLQIYTDMSITNWAELGGTGGRIIPLNRDWHSGSQTLMDNLVLEGREVNPAFDSYQIGDMMSMIWAAGIPSDFSFTDGDPNNFALGYTVYFYAQQSWGLDNLRILALDGAIPSHESILSGEYPLSSNYFVVLRADSPQNSPERNLAEWLTTQAGQNAVENAELGRLLIP